MDVYYHEQVVSNWYAQLVSGETATPHIYRLNYITGDTKCLYGDVFTATFVNMVG